MVNQVPHRAHLFSLKIGHAFFAACIKEKYTKSRFFKDLLAGLTVGIIAIPLSMALAIASGVAPQYGLYTAVIGGFIIALTGGSRYSISGPTAAFVVLLAPISHQYGLAGLLVATVMSGIILIIMATLRLGRLIQYIPDSITLGFTAGIGVVIATLQLKDFFGLNIHDMPEHYWDKVATIVQAMPGSHWPSLLIAIATLGTMLLWPKLKLPVPAHLPAVIIGSVIGLLLNHYGIGVETIGSRFHYILPNGVTGMGIPPVLPEFKLPWLQMNANGAPLGLSWDMIQALLPKAFAIAMLGAIESLLCAVVLDGMTNTRHSANSELLGQGFGNIIAPFFGGIPATAAIARSAANVKAGAQSPVSAIVHSIIVLLALVALTKILAYIPMSAMAALLLMVAWNMSEAPKAVRLLKTAPKSDIAVFLTCFILTVVFDMVIAISVGLILAALLFMKQIAEMTRVKDISHDRRYMGVMSESEDDRDTAILRIDGPLFFAAADNVFGEISQLAKDKHTIILQMDGVHLLDVGGLSALVKLISKCDASNTRILICELQFQPLRTLAKANIQPIEGKLKFYPKLTEALADI